jgi:hypothetical protein
VQRNNGTDAAGARPVSGVRLGVGGDGGDGVVASSLVGVDGAGSVVTTPLATAGRGCRGREAGVEVGGWRGRRDRGRGVGPCRRGWRAVGGDGAARNSRAAPSTGEVGVRPQQPCAAHRGLRRGCF